MPYGVYANLDDYQRDVVDQALIAKTYGVFLEQGLGKTWITGGCVERLAAQTRNMCALLVVPLNNIETTWVDLFSSRLPHLHLARSVDEFHALEPELRSPFCCRVLILHYEAVPAIIKQLRKIKWHFIAYDESHRIAHRQTDASRAAAHLGKNDCHKLLLSGTPIEQSPQDLWAQYRFARPSLFGTRYKDFEDQFFEPINYEKELKGLKRGSVFFQRRLLQLTIKKKKRPFINMDKFLRMIKPYSIRLTDDVLGLKPMTITPEYVSLYGEQRRIYEELERDEMVRALRTTAPLKITKKMKLRQVIGGTLIDDDGITHTIGRAKLRRTRTLVKKANGRPIVIFCEYIAEVYALLMEFKDEHRVAFITGLNRKERPVLIRDFQAGRLDILICQSRSGGVGIDLYRSSFGILYSLPESSIVFRQLFKRLHRRGQLNAVEFHVLLCENTVDEPMYEALQTKGKVSASVLDYLKRKYQHGKRTR